MLASCAANPVSVVPMLSQKWVGVAIRLGEGIITFPIAVVPLASFLEVKRDHLDSADGTTLTGLAAQLADMYSLPAPRYSPIHAVFGSPQCLRRYQT